jgi:glycosyltransferase involved in cell wall biosynthesis
VGVLEALQRLNTDHEFILYPTFGDAFWDPVGPQATWQGQGPAFTRWTPHESRQAARDFWSARHGDLDDALGNPDVVHSHSYFCPTKLQRARLVYTLYDLSFLVGPEWTTEANRQVCFTGVLNASMHADLIIAISEASRRHFLEAFPHYPAERTAVVHPASRFESCDPVLRPPSCDRLKPGRFFLSVGTIEPRKNLSRLVAAYAGYATSSQDPLPLVLVGGSGWLMEGFDREIRSLEIARRIIRLGYVDDRALQWLYQNCRAFLYPSLLEGFGLPVVEALSQGAAVLTSNRSSLPEVAGDAALLVDPTSTEALHHALGRLATEEALRTRLRGLAVAQAARFSWQTAAQQTLAYYDQVVQMDRLAQKPAVERRLLAQLA